MAAVQHGCRSIVDVMRALGNPVRWRLFVHIATSREVPVADIVVGAAVSRAAMSYHLGVLRDAGLVQIRREGRRRYCRVRAEPGARLVAAARRLGDRRAGP